MQVRPLKVQGIAENDLLIFNDGDDRHFTVAMVTHKSVHVPNDPKLKTYRLTLDMGNRTCVNTYYHNESVDKVVSL